MLTRLPFLQPVESKTRERFVYSWDALVAAVGDYMADATAAISSGNFDVIGRVIRLGCAFPWKGTVSIPSSCPGLRIDGAGVVVVPNAAGMVMFSAAASFLTIRDVIAYQATGGFAWGTFASVSGGDIHLENCRMTGNRLLDMTAGDDSTVDRCHCESDTPSTWVNAAGVIGLRVQNSRFKASSSNAIVLGALSERCNISGNVFSGSGIITTASNGSNVIIGNVNTGVITAHATDKWRDSGLVSLNT